MCKVCRGRPSNVLLKHRCLVCRKTNKDYLVLYDAEVAMLQELREIWERCKSLKLMSSGFKKKDLVLELLFGPPHNDNWRNYELYPLTAVSASPFIVLRLTGV